MIGSVAVGYYYVYHHTAVISWEMVRSCRTQESGPSCVFRWLKRNRIEIARDAHKYGVSRLAIGGIVAYESLEDVDPPEVALVSRYSGPGKVHYKNWRFWEGEPVAKTVEDRGYLRRQNMQARRRLLSTDSGAISYIAAILVAYSEVALKYGYRINCKPDLLATFYSAWAFDTEAALFKKRPRALRPNDVGRWVSIESIYLRNALGAPCPECCA